MIQSGHGLFDRFSWIGMRKAHRFHLECMHAYGDVNIEKCFATSLCTPDSIEFLPPIIKEMVKRQSTVMATQ